MKTNWEVQVMFYRADNQNEVFSTKQFNNLTEKEITESCKKNMDILLNRYPDVIKVEFEAVDLIHRPLGHPKSLSFIKKR